MAVPGKSPSSNRYVGVVVAVLLLGLGTFVILSGRNDEKSKAVPTEAEARTAAHVRPEHLPPLKIRKSPSGDRVISLDSDLYFAFDKARLTGPARSQLRDQVLPRVLALLGRPGGWVDLRGYTDGAGDDAYNLRLSLRRAEAARRFLIAAGAPSEGLGAHGFGERLATSPERNRALRRVDVVLHEGGSR